MSAFLSSAGLAYLAATLLASAAGHVRAPRAFRDLVGAHGIVPRRLATPVALAVPAFELAAGATALVLATQHRPDVAATAVVCGVTAIAGAAFVAYVRRLLRASSSLGCGCSPLAGPTTLASQVPAAGLALAAAIAFAATALLDPGGAAGGAAGALPYLWGVTLAAIVMLVPATMPAPPAAEPLR